MKKILLFVLILIASTFENVYAATTDVTAPIVKNISIKGDKKEFKYGERIYLDLDIYDDVSGVKDISFITTLPENYYNPNGFTWYPMKVYFDENNNPYTMIPTSYYNSKYYIVNIFVTDNAGNFKSYYLNHPTYESNPITEKDYIDITVDFELIEGTEWKEPHREDKTGPVITNFKIDKESSMIGETITFSLNAIDDISGVRDDIYATFVAWENGEAKTFNVQFKKIKNDLYEGTFIPKTNAGVYSLYYVSAWDLAGNDTMYKPNENIQVIIEENENYIIEERIMVIKSIKVDKEEYAIPSYGKVELEIDSNYETANNAIVNFSSDKGTINVELQKTENNKYEGVFEINQFLSIGEYKLDSIYVGYADMYEHPGERFSNKEATGSFTDPTQPLNIDLSIKLTSKVDADVVTGTNANDLIKKITDAEDNAIIYIDGTTNPIIEKEVFEAIQETNKTIHIESSGIEWIFKGTDITNPKEINTELKINYDYSYTEENFNNYVNKALILIFKDNGELPGVATIQIKLDYALKDYLGENIYVYYYDENGKMFTPVVDGEIKENKNGYFEFKITHNSIYIFSNEEPKKDKINDTDELTKLNTIYQKDNSNINDNNQDNNAITFIIVIILIISIILITIEAVLVINHKRIDKKKEEDNKEDQINSAE